MGKKKIKLVGIFLFFSSFLFLLFPIIRTKVETKYVERIIETYIQNESDYKSIASDVLGILEIPSISLKKFFYKIDSLKNDVNKNIYVLPVSIFPDQMYSNVLLASHSGYGKIAFFHHLEKLRVGDFAYLYYQEQKYTYKLSFMYQEIKDGTITLHQESEKKYLTLITCNQKQKNLQNIYVFEML